MPRSPALSRVACFVLGAAVLFTAVPAEAGGADPATARPFAFLVRHAEKDAAGGEDPVLSPDGAARAQRLADLLAEQPIARVYVSDTRRARDTAEPLATRLAIPVELYDPKKLAELAGLLRERGESALVVGHSNTTDELAVALGGESAGRMPDEEYGRLYRVDLVDGSTILQRY